MVSENTLTVEKHGLALPRGDSDFRLAVDRAVSELYASGRMAAFFEEAFPGATPGVALRALFLLGPDCPDRGAPPMPHAHAELPKTPANYVPLTPVGFLAKAAAIYPERPAVVYGAIRRTWAETAARCRRLASALVRAGLAPGETVAVVATNTPELYEAHFGVPMAGGVLNAINCRLDARTIGYILDHAEAKVLITDREFSPIVSAALDAGDAPPPRHRHRRPRRARGRAPRRDRLRGVPRHRRSRPSPGPAPPTSGTPSRSTTPPAPPATRRASSTTTAAPT